MHYIGPDTISSHRSTHLYSLDHEMIKVNLPVKAQINNPETAVT